MKEKRPSPADADAWSAVARGVKPLPGRVRPSPAPAPPPKKAASLPRPRPVEIAAPPPHRLRMGLPPIEDRMLKSIRRGQTPLDMRLDLHGETQARAQRLLERVLAAGRARGARIVLVVTGTGLRRRLERDPETGDPVFGKIARQHKNQDGPAPDETPGVLRRMLPHWLAQPPLSGWVLGLSPAAPHHGGAGAFYVLLRKERTV